MPSNILVLLVVMFFLSKYSISLLYFVINISDSFDLHMYQLEKWFYHRTWATVAHCTCILICTVNQNNSYLSSFIISSYTYSFLQFYTPTQVKVLNNYYKVKVLKENRMLWEIRSKLIQYNCAC